jgi:hypothetical protein
VSASGRGGGSDGEAAVSEEGAGDVRSLGGGTRGDRCNDPT